VGSFVFSLNKVFSLAGLPLSLPFISNGHLEKAHVSKWRARRGATGIDPPTFLHSGAYKPSATTYSHPQRPTSCPSDWTEPSADESDPLRFPAMSATCDDYLLLLASSRGLMKLNCNGEEPCT